MLRLLLLFGKQAARLTLLLLLIAGGTLALVRYAPGYFADSREMDATYATAARSEIESRQASDASAARLATETFRGWLKGNFGTSRQYDVAVTELLGSRLAVSARLLSASFGAGFFAALALALPLSSRRGMRGEPWIVAASSGLLALPLAALATFFLLAGTGGPGVALAVVIGARDFKFLYRLLRVGWSSGPILYARSQGIRPWRIGCAHLLPAVLLQLLAVGRMSFVLALSALVPAEVIFNVPGVGQLAWNAAMNRDLPVLLAVTLLMALAVGLTSLGKPARAYLPNRPALAEPS